MKLKKGIPRHKQISDQIRKKIETGDYESNEKLPSENEMTKIFGVSRVTIRRALQTLENEDLIYRCQGLGSFVTDQRSHQSFTRLTDFTEDMKRLGMEASSQVLQMNIVALPDKVAMALQLDKGNTGVRLDRLRLGDEKPVAFDITWLPVFYGQLIENHDLSQETIFGILEREYEIPIKKGCYRIEAENANAYLAKHLAVEVGTALLLIDRLSLTIGEKPVYFQKRYYRTDRITYELTAERNPADDADSSDLPLREFVPVSNDEENG
ncbi:MAG TPA: GntR family transcriptional regulator [Balneolaceae bacterium]|nr:GntR family transcriptional regulator [Balneolaceae bacterium]